MECQEPCPFCASVRGQVFVHGHYQCVDCGQNVTPCCEGAPSEYGVYNSNQQKDHLWNKSS